MMDNAQPTPSFEEWLAEALSDGEIYLPVEDGALVNAYVTRFNQEIGQLVKQHGEQLINTAIWYIYGSGSGYIQAALNASLGERRCECLTSVRRLYADGFAPRCSKHFGHLDRGPEPARPLNGACYMLWDLDGIECPAFQGDKEMLAASLEVLSFALALDNWACQESALHGLGHLAPYFPQETTPIIREYLRSNAMPPELRKYAEKAMTGCVL